MDLEEAMRCAPTSRRFTEEPVSEESLHRALDAARFAPSGGNRQGWRVIVVREPERRAKLGELYLKPWREYMVQTGMAHVLANPDDFEPAVLRRTRRANDYAESLGQIPVHLVLGV